VTANKRRENIQDVPSRSRISASDLRAWCAEHHGRRCAIPGLTMQGSMNGLEAHLRDWDHPIAAGEENSSDIH